MRSAMTSPRCAPPRQQRGYVLLLGLAIGLAIFAGALSVWARVQSRSSLLSSDAQIGQSLGQWAVGLRGFVAAAQAAGSVPTGPLAGVNWLKPPSCGGMAGNPAAGYVPCTYTGGVYGPKFVTTFYRDASTNAIEARTTFVLPAGRGDAPNARIVSAARIARDAMAQNALPNTGTFFAAWANVPTNALGPNAPAGAGDQGRVLLVVNNAPANDIYLRTDGTNQMLANLNVGGYSIANARDGAFAGNVRVNGVAQVDGGLTALGVSDLRGGVLTNEVGLTSIGKYATQGIYDARVLTGASSYTITKIDCSQAGGAPGIYASLQGTGSPNWNGAYNGDAIYDAHVDVVDMGGSWQVRPIVNSVRMNLASDINGIYLTKTMGTVNPGDARVVVMQRCR